MPWRIADYSFQDHKDPLETIWVLETTIDAHGRGIRRGLYNLNGCSSRVRARQPHPNHSFILINSQNLSIPNLHN